MKKQKSALSQLLKESFLATLLVFVSVWILFLVISISFKPFNFVAKTIKDVNLTDFYFSGLQSPVADTNIILVNIEDLGRKDIAALVDTIYAAGPAVIGLDVFFSDDTDSIGDPLLNASIKHAADKLVLAGFYDAEANRFNSDYKIFPGSDYGHANILTNEDRTAVVRKFQPAYKLGDSLLYAFSAAIARKYNKQLFDKLASRKNKAAYINYKGNKSTYLVLNHVEVLDSAADLAFMKNKIVMIGFLGGKTKSTEDFNDIFYTPVNKHYYGRALPDMYGLVIHANTASMIIEDNYIWYPADWLVFIISFIITFLHIVPFIYFYVNRHLWYHVFVKIGQLVSFTVILLLVFLIFKNTSVLIPTKYILLPVILAADILYLYEALAVLVYKKTGRKSLFIHEHKHDEPPVVEVAVTEEDKVHTDPVPEEGGTKPIDEEEISKPVL
ncbi:MAG: CHASE2 domain-containing protein [Ferruginibacter sp.]